MSACGSVGGKGDIVGYGKNADYKDAVKAATSTKADPSSLDPIAAAAYWGTAYERAPVAENAVRYSAALRKIGSSKEAAIVMQKAQSRFPNNPDVGLEYGKTLIEEGRAFEAVRPLEVAAKAKSQDWRAQSALGVAFDQIGEHDAARRKYDDALALSPNNPVVMNNKGLSYAMDGDLKTAVRTLRAATAAPGGDARMRQNLALALAINGDMREAERLARSDLPPQLAENNIDYFRQLMTQPAFWQDYAKGAETPNFDAPKPLAPAAKKPSKPAPAKSLDEPKEDKKTKTAPVATAKPVAPTNASETLVEPKKATPATPAAKVEAKPAAATQPTTVSAPAAAKPAPAPKAAPAPAKPQAKPATPAPAGETPADPAPNIKK
jgi:Flp pilus assembly protein TadD